ncbi:hypothetical protein Mal15_14060 [Stieleria maiorica]|uniref:Uncharacterized protein n=1 Tax=Stieleria maiorica TaxID=2795974 RepID=A0A5B9MAW2_9BACT|nr:hypothetical protein [Stieleria maiorica]QEF97366.1 hypothetical protein Mal15_14060 [Stieleria maiorica]
MDLFASLQRALAEQNEQTEGVGDCLNHDRTTRTSNLGKFIIAKNQNAFAKRAREMEKKRKAEAKLNRRKERKAAESALPQAQSDDETEEVAPTQTEKSPADEN